MKKLFFTALALLAATALHAQEEEPIPWRKDITMLVIPREPLVIQVAQDISRRYPSLIVCYQSTPAGPILHAWNGESWVGVSTNDYINGTFFTHRPQSAVIVEPEGRPAHELLIPDGTWCDSGNRLSSADTRTVIHLLGRRFDFPYRYWMQFSRRYNYALEEINPALINVPWVHYRGDKVNAAFKARDFDRDMDKWSDLQITPPKPIEPVLIEKPVELPPAEIPAIEPPEEEIIDQPVDMPDEAVAEAPAEMIIEQPAAAKTIEEIMVEISEKTPAPEVEITPFSTNEIPAAELILTPAE
jgi:hypothetical protein